MEKSSYYLLLLSLLPSTIYRQVIPLLETQTAYEIYSSLEAAKRKTIAHISTLYNENPEAAADKIVLLCQKYSIEIINYSSHLYPPLLRTIADPPLVLYWQGGHLQPAACAVVGSREVDRENRYLTERICRTLAGKGYTLVSGIARGIDREVHLAALAEKTATIAVTACGLDSTYPVSNRDLFAHIRNSPQSALISEYPPGMGIMKWTFVRRNRIISGLAAATIVIKAGAKSGALITARAAIEQNRELFVCPAAPYTPGFEGCFALINQGAIALYSADQLFSVYESVNQNSRDGEQIHHENRLSLTGDELFLYKIAQSGVKEIDEIVRISRLSVAKVTQLILSLELMSYIRRSGSSINLL